MTSFEPLGKFLVFCGIFVVLLGLFLVFWEKIPFLGRLPGDIFLRKGNFRFFFPIVTCLVLSAVLTIVVSIVLKLLGK